MNPEMVNIIQEWIKTVPKTSILMLQNATYDAKVLYKYGINILNFEWFDTMVAGHLLDEVSSCGLKYMANKYLGVDTESYESASKDSTKFLEYCMNDAEWTYKLAKLFAPKLKEEGLELLFRKIEMPFLRVIFMMETTGWKVDIDKVNTITTHLEEEIFEIQRKMYELLGERYEIQPTLDGKLTLVGNLNFNSGQHLATIMFDRLGLEDVGVTDSGRRKTGKEAINKLAGQHPFIELLQQYKVASKLLEGFFNPMPKYIDEDGRVRSSFNDCGTKTGRLSSSNPNLQQLPKKNKAFPVETRSCFVAPVGKKLIAADYSGQELRVLAHISNDKGLIDAFNSGKDFHQETADKFGVSRTQAKAINFGVAYGKGAYGFAKDWKTTEEEAQKFLDLYFSSFPKVKDAIENTTKEVKKEGYVTNLVGRKRRLPLVVDGDNKFYRRSSFREAFNFKIQGFSADMMRIASIKVLNLCTRNPQWSMKIIALIHDEIVTEVNEQYAEEAKIAINKAMITAVKLKVPVLADVHIGDDYSQIK
jgi:DNA polymerase-1